ncbi:DUF4382 domain-containing protein [Pseudoduganella violacea]|uniref:DUF4382 domain-containing protein n=1 Tax=Pseudoduganella violacea TaxID=1715466 RepID=A0A7W5FTY1_9BURK|nr:DUF4382 domain-containing protein [Pseudoduganella violacea]MBB3119122.1 hypothetical protein [Pseudoduganella violacea]
MKTSRLFPRLAAGAAISAALVLLASCGGGGGGGNGGTPPPTTTMGTVAVSLTDAPACGFDAVNITVAKVRIHASNIASDTDSGWTDITLTPARKINLLNLTNGALEALGQTSLATGHYSQIRLVLDANAGNGLANTVVPTGSTAERSLDTPSAVQSGIKLVNDFDVGANQRVDLVLDFDACKSIVTKGNGNYALKPVIKVVPTTLNGISGFIAPALLASHVAISAQQAGAIIAATVPSASGEFALTRLPAGNYDVVITADDRAASVVGAVPVTASAMTALSTTAAPINMTASVQGSISGTVTLTPSSATEAATVTARQVISGGPAVALRYQGADLLNGSYTLDKLPVAAIRYAPYSATLPLVFNASASTPGSGQYRLDATAVGYAVQTKAAIDISMANQTGVNFTLTP